MTEETNVQPEATNEAPESADSSNPEDVKQAQPDDKEQKALEQVENLNKALQEEREKRKAYEKEKEDAERNAKIKKGKAEEVIQELSEAKTKLEQELAEASKFQEFYKEEKQREIKSLTNKIPEDKREFVAKIIDGKADKDAVDILREFATQYSKPEYNPNPNASNSSKDPNHTNKFDEAKEKKDARGMAASIMQGLLGG